MSSARNQKEVNAKAHRRRGAEKTKPVYQDSIGGSLFSATPRLRDSALIYGDLLLLDSRVLGFFCDL
jgi:hypothetical protein